MLSQTRSAWIFARRIATRCTASRRQWRASLSEPNWVTAEQLIDANADIVADTGEPHCVLKPNELESACARPQNLWHYEEEENVVALAVGLLAGIIQNHPFQQGNKRVGLVGARNFLQSNGYDIGLTDEELEPAMMDFVAGHIAEDDLVEILEEHLIDA